VALRLHRSAIGFYTRSGVDIRCAASGPRNCRLAIGHAERIRTIAPPVQRMRIAARIPSRDRIGRGGAVIRRQRTHAGLRISQARPFAAISSRMRVDIGPPTRLCESPIPNPKSRRTTLGKRAGSG